MRSQFFFFSNRTYTHTRKKSLVRCREWRQTRAKSRVCTHPGKTAQYNELHYFRPIKKRAKFKYQPPPRFHKKRGDIIIRRKRPISRVWKIWVDFTLSRQKKKKIVRKGMRERQLFVAGKTFFLGTSEEWGFKSGLARPLRRERERERRVDTKSVVMGIQWGHKLSQSSRRSLTTR